MGRRIAQAQETTCKALIGLPKCAGAKRRNAGKRFHSEGSVRGPGTQAGAAKSPFPRPTPRGKSLRIK